MAGVALATYSSDYNSFLVVKNLSLSVDNLNITAQFIYSISVQTMCTTNSALDSEVSQTQA